MLHAVQHSIIEHLKVHLPEINGTVVWMFNGVKLPTNAPFGTVENLNTVVRGLDKLYEYDASNYNFQVGIFARTEDELVRLQDKAKKVIMGKPITYYDTSVEPATINGDFRANVTGITPIKGDDESNLKGKHRSYLDVTVFSLNKLN